MHQGGAEPGQMQAGLRKLFAGGSVTDSTVWGGSSTELGSTRVIAGLRGHDHVTPPPSRSSLAASPGTRGI